MSQKLIMVIVLAVSAAASGVAVGQTIPQRVAAASSEPVVIGSLVDVRPVTLEALARGADVIVEATLTRQRSYLSPDQKAVFTDYLVIPEHALGGRMPTLGTKPGTSTPIVLTVYGGEVIVSGVQVRAVSHNTKPIRNGGRYLLFLVPFDAKSGRYQLFEGGAFELDGDRIKPVRKEYDTVFPELAGSRYSELKAGIEEAAKER